jgi:preprotein translocase subunit SecG
MGTFISILIVIVCLLLVIVVLIQNSKGGGLSSTFASSNQVMGVRKTADFLEKATWTLAIALLALCLFAVPYSKGKSGDKEAVESVTRKKAENNIGNAVPTATPPPGINVAPSPPPAPAPAPPKTPGK